MPQLTLESMVNRNLFSYHYLENLIQKNPEWKMNNHLEAFQQIKRIYLRELAFIEGLNESQLEKRFFRDIFKLLLPNFEVQATSKNQEFPDYAFFPNKQSLDDAHEEKGKKSFYTGAFAVGEVKRWNIELDKFGKDKHDRRRNPSFQIWLYLHETEPHWGILSNGRKWRLYHQDKPLDCYYEIDLVSLIEKDDLEGFRYFYYFFRQEAFVSNEKGEIFLDRVLRESADYAKEIGDNLKENVYRAMKIISDGFLHWNQNRLDISNEKVRMEAQKSTMRLLYRLLFLLYAEGKGLLDLSDEIYRNSYSFYRLKKEIAEKKEGPRNEYYSPASTTLWSKLRDLFRLIDQGSEAFDIPKEQFYVPAYNGGLFDAQKNLHLEQWNIADNYLADAIDLLARNETKEGMAYVDYSTLEIRHLGSIYEGLLEYRLRIAETDLVATGGNRREWVNLDDYNMGKKSKKIFDDFDSFDRVRRGEIYLATDKGERKATGSYYTPDYIVNYIVENTVGPIIDSKWKNAIEEDTPYVEATISVNILDPAMGSGHFLVGAVEYLAARLLEAVQRDIEEGRLEADEHYTPDWAKREVVSHCIYGVDLNEMAVELGKLSLWLTTISKDKPLSFLDHRLKCGNSLIGSDLADLPWHPNSKIERMQKRIDIPSGFIQKLVETVDCLASIDDDTLEHVRQKEQLFQEFKNTREYDMIRTLADVRTSLYFGNEVEQQVYGSYTGDAYFSTESQWNERREKYFAKKAREIGENMRFFHWELEYPEIFFDEGKVKKNPGFDAVIGNPPYDVLAEKELGYSIDDEKKFFSLTNSYEPGVKNKLNLYRLFIVKGLGLTRLSGFFSFIVPMAILGDNQATPTRQWLLEKFQFNRIEAFPQKDNPYRRIFFEAKLPTAIIVLRKDLPKDEFEVITHPGRELSEIDKRYCICQNDIFDFDKHTFSIPLLEDAEWKLIRRLLRSSIIKRIGDIHHSYQGEINETSMASFLAREELGPEILRGGVIQRYCLLNSPKQGERYFLDIEKYDREISDNSKKSHVHQARLCYQRNSALDNWRRLLFTIVPPSNHFFDSISYLLPKEQDIHFMLALLNSKLLEFWFRTTSTNNHVNGYEIEALPYREVFNNTPQDKRKSLLSEAENIYCTSIQDGSYSLVLEFVEACFPKDENGNYITEKEQSDVVHDLLSYLAQEMLNMNRELIREIDGFLNWLEVELSVEMEELTNRTQIRNYYSLTFDDFLGYLKKNSKKMTVNLSNRDLQQRLLRPEFEKSLIVLTPLIERIRWTDLLIDQIVYRLYGLTEEEIMTVESAVS